MSPNNRSRITEALVAKLEPHLSPQSEMSEWLGVAANLWDTFSMIGVLLTGAIIWLFYRDDPSKVLDVVILAACAVAVITLLVFAFVVRNWRRSIRRNLLKKITSLDEPGLGIVVQVLLERPDTLWDFKYLGVVCLDREQVLFGARFDNISQLDELKDRGLIVVERIEGEEKSDRYTVRLTDHCRQNSNYLLQQFRTASAHGAMS